MRQLPNEINSPGWRMDQMELREREILRVFGHKAHRHTCCSCLSVIGAGNCLLTPQTKCPRDTDHSTGICFLCNIAHAEIKYSALIEEIKTSLLSPGYTHQKEK